MLGSSLNASIWRILIALLMVSVLVTAVASAQDAGATNPANPNAPTSPAKSQSSERQCKSAYCVPEGTLSLIVAIGSASAMLIGLWLVFARLKAKEQGFGPNSLKALGLVMFLPTLAMVAVTVKAFETQTLAALLGTVAGYVLSQSRGENE